MNLHLEVLPQAQRIFWEQYLHLIPKTFVLYGGTAVALLYGHRQSIDFDFFSSTQLPMQELEQILPLLSQSPTLQKTKDTLVVQYPIQDQEVKLSFFCSLGFGRVGTPNIVGSFALAAPIDLLATKLKALHDRVEAKDYLDIEVLLRSGLGLTEGIWAARTLFGSQLNPLDTAKAVAWFKDGGLEKKLSPRTKNYLQKAAETFDPSGSPPLKLSSQLHILEHCG